MKICLVAAFPPSGRQLNEYALYVARELQRNPDVELTILADELTEYGFATDANGNAVETGKQPELPGFNVIRCWKVGSLATPMRLLNTVRRLKPDVVWFNLVFSSFGTPESPLSAFVGLAAPALTRAAGFYTHITLHQIVERVDFAAAGVRREKLYRMGTDLATRILLKAHSVSVLISGYRRTLMAKYSAENIVLGTHGIFTTISNPPDFTKRGNPDLRILAFGNWGTYKRLETLMEAFPAVLKQVPNARLIVAGPNHPSKAGYWESIREAQPAGLPIEFKGYIPRQDVPELFRTSSIMVMPYDSATGSSGPAHQACEYGVPILCADIPDFREMAADEDMAIAFYKTGDAADLAAQLVSLLQAPEVLQNMAEHNFAAGVQMTMDSVVRNYLRWFELHKVKREMRRAGLGRMRPSFRSLFTVPKVQLSGERPSNSSRLTARAGKRKTEVSIEHHHIEGYQAAPTLKSES
ncbi:MAG TPA: glycosyltransferase [Acidobacteriaceae bacterium]|nr:glycosyltransferase [Acidobacteriaceae bacterium]